MSSSPTVVVKKGGVLTAFVSGVFGTLIVCIVCGAGLAFYALNVADRTVGEVFNSGTSLLQAVPELRDSLAIVADLLDDRREPEYRNELELSARVAQAPGHRDRPVVIVDVTNNGSKTVTYLTARVVVEDSRGVPLPERRVCVATPVQIDEDDWRGPLLPDSQRRFTVHLWDLPADADLTASIEVTDLRVWNQKQDEVAQTDSVTVDAPSTP